MSQMKVVVFVPISQAEAAETRCISRLNGKDNQEWENRVLQRRVLVALSSRVEYRVYTLYSGDATKPHLSVE